MLAVTFPWSLAIADTTIRYRVEGTCSGDFDEVQLKEHWLRADSHQGGGDNSMIYDGAEKLAYFIDDRSRTFMQVELDEDAVDLQKDVMTSLAKNVKHRTGFDPFALNASRASLDTSARGTQTQRVPWATISANSKSS